MIYLIVVAVIVYLLIGIRSSAWATLTGLKQENPLSLWQSGGLVIWWLPTLLLSVFLLPFSFCAWIIVGE